MSNFVKYFFSYFVIQLYALCIANYGLSPLGETYKMQDFFNLTCQDTLVKNNDRNTEILKGYTFNHLYSFKQNEPKDNPTQLVNPCDDYILAMQKDPIFINAFHNLNIPSITTNSYESGYEVTNRTINRYLPLVGQFTNTKEIKWTIKTPIDGVLHNHSDGGNSIFSPADIIFLAKIFLSNYARDSSNLFMGVTSYSNPPYLVKIGNLAEFRIFANKIAGTEKSAMAFIKENDNKVVNLNDAVTNELGLLNMIRNNLGSQGLILYRGNKSCNRWTKLSIDDFNNISYVDCF